MMLHRARAQVRYPTPSGLAVWSRDQMAVRYGQAVHINPGAANEEAPVNEATDQGDGTTIFRCDLPLMDEPAAVDALATLTAASVWGQALPLPGIDGDDLPSYVEHHLCDHDEDVRTGCTIVNRVESDIATDTAEPWVQPTGGHDAYPAGATVTHNGQTWTNTPGDGNVWEPGAGYGWTSDAT